jgi:hypothetical protein
VPTNPVAIGHAGIASDAATVIVSGRSAVRESASDTLKTTGIDPAAEGVPEILPAADRVRPAGKLPDPTDHAYGGLPPVADRVWLYSAPTVAVGTAVVVILSGAAPALITIRSWRVAD